MTIAAVRWPTDAKTAVRQYLNFQIVVLKEQGIELPSVPNDPILIAEKWTTGLLSDAELDVARDAWWDVIDTSGLIQDFQSRQALDARLALCLLTPRERDAGNLGEHLSWFLEVLDFRDDDVKRAIDLMKSHFDLA